MGNCFSEDHSQSQPNADGSPPDQNSTSSSATADQDNAAVAQEESPSQKEEEPPPAAEKPLAAEPVAVEPVAAEPVAAAAPAEPPSIGDVLGGLMEDVRATYTLGKELGRGEFGVTYLCTDKYTGDQFACKTINKRRLTCEEDVEDIRREVKIMQHLKGKPNIVQLIGAFEDKQSVHLIMELCAGGELFDRILARGHYTERAAASLLRTIVHVIHTCHSMGVMHRDLKPENFLLLNSDEDSPLKATDFGLSIFFKEGDVFTDVVGSAFYIAPEVLNRKYGPEADIWSIGVMLYIFLCGVPPFWAESEKEIFSAVMQGYLDFVTHPWPKISSSAKDLVRKMINSDPQERLTAAEVLDHPWIREGGDAPDTPMDESVLSRLKQFRAMNQFKKAALRVIADCLSEEELTELKEIFKNMDSDNSGTITLEELRKGLSNQGTKLTDYEVLQLMEAADVDGNGTIDYDEFITATIQINRKDREAHLYTAFQFFDKDDSGFITTEELEQALEEKGMYDEEKIKDAISEADADKDGRINYDEFVAMMRKGNEQNNPRKRRDARV